MHAIESYTVLVCVEHRQKQLHNAHTPFTSSTALFPGLPRWAGTRKVKPIWILLKQETVSGSGISWDTPAPHRSVFYRPDALPAAQPTASNTMHAIKTTPNLLFEYQCTRGKFIRLPIRIESKKIDSVARIESNQIETFFARIGML